MAAIQSAEALKILSGNRDRVSRFLTVVSLWDNQVRQLNTAGLRSQVDCPSCGQHRLDWLDGRRGSQSSVLCGRNAVQIRLDEVTTLDLGRLAEQFSAEQILLQNSFMMRVEVDALVLTLFPDGRAIVTGTEDLQARRPCWLAMSAATRAHETCPTGIAARRSSGTSLFEFAWTTPRIGRLEGTRRS